MPLPSDPNRGDIATDLIEYLVVVVPGPEALTSVALELAQAVERAAVRILDVLVVSVDEQGSVELIEADSVEGLGAVGVATPGVGILLSRHDVELVALALEPESTAIVVLVEDRWAEPLSTAARAAGGHVHAGERIARERVEAALARATAGENTP